MSLLKWKRIYWIIFLELRIFPCTEFGVFQLSTSYFNQNLLRIFTQLKFFLHTLTRTARSYVLIKQQYLALLSVNNISVTDAAGLFSTRVNIIFVPVLGGNQWRDLDFPICMHLLLWTEHNLSTCLIVASWHVHWCIYYMNFTRKRD